MIEMPMARFVDRWITTSIDTGPLVPKSWLIITVSSQMFREVQYVRRDDKVFGLWAAEQLSRMRRLKKREPGFI